MAVLVTRQARPRRSRIGTSAMVVAGVVEHVHELVGRGRGELRLVVASFEKSPGDSWSSGLCKRPWGRPTARTSPPPPPPPS